MSVRNMRTCRESVKACILQFSLSSILLWNRFEQTDARFPSFRCRSSVAVSPFCRCKIPLFCKNYVRKFRSVTAVNSKKKRSGSGNGNGNGVRQRLTGTAKWQRKNGNGMMETRHDSEGCRVVVRCVGNVSGGGDGTSRWRPNCHLRATSESI